MRTRLIAAATVLAAGSALALSACSSTPEPAPKPTAPSSSSAAPSPTESTPAIGGDPATWAPVEINPMNAVSSPIVLVPNQRAIFIGLKDGQAYKVVSQDATVVQGVDGAAGERPGLIALKPGTSVVQLELDGAMVYNAVTISVEPQKG